MVRETSGRVRIAGERDPTAQDLESQPVADRDVTERRRPAGRHIDARHLERHHHLRAGEADPTHPADRRLPDRAAVAGEMPPHLLRSQEHPDPPTRGRTVAGDVHIEVTEHAPDPGTTATVAQQLTVAGLYNSVAPAEE